MAALFSGINLFGKKHSSTRSVDNYSDSSAVKLPTVPSSQPTNGLVAVSGNKSLGSNGSLEELNPRKIPNTEEPVSSLHSSNPSSTALNETQSTSAHKSVIVRKGRRGEVKLFESTTERRRLEELADLFSIIRTTESIEAAYSRDAITEKEYAEVCFRLISQFKTTESALLTAGSLQSVEKFIDDYSIDCPRAFHRLIRVGVPATVMNGSHDDRGESIIVAETVYNFTAFCRLKVFILIDYAGTSLYYCDGCVEAGSAVSG